MPTNDQTTFIEHREPPFSLYDILFHRNAFLTITLRCFSNHGCDSVLSYSQSNFTYVRLKRWHHQIRTTHDNPCREKNGYSTSFSMLSPRRWFSFRFRCPEGNLKSRLFSRCFLTLTPRRDCLLLGHHTTTQYQFYAYPIALLLSSPTGPAPSTFLFPTTRGKRP